MGRTGEVRSSYASLAARYIDLFGRTDQVHPDDLDLVERRLAIRPGLVLDVGCGPGHLTAHLRSLGVDAAGTDLVPEFVEHARVAHPGVRYDVAATTELPYPDGSVVGILAWYSLIHDAPDELAPVLAELRRVVVPGATLVAGFFDSETIEPFPHQVVTAYRWPIDEFAARLEQAGFVEVERQQRPGIDVAGSRPHAAIVAIAE